MGIESLTRLVEYVGGSLKYRAAVKTSSGPTDAGRIPALGDNGRLDASLLDATAFGTNDYNLLINKPTLGSAAAKNVGTLSSEVSAGDHLHTGVYQPAGSYLTGNQTVTLSGDATGSGATSITVTLASSGVTAGTWPKVTVDAKGRVTAGEALAATDIPALDWSKITTGKPTTLAGYGITDAVASTHNHTLDGLGNVTITANSAGEILKWNGTAWVNNTLAEAGIQPALGFTAENSANKGAVNGYASLDALGKVPSSQLPSTSSGAMTVVSAGSSNFTAASGNHYLVTTASQQITLPAAPAIGDTIYFTAAINPFSIMRNGKSIMGMAEDLAVDKSSLITFGLRFIENSTSVGWVIL